MKLTKQKLKQIIKEELQAAKESIVKKGFGGSMVTHKDYEQDPDEPERAETGEPPLKSRDEAMLAHEWKLARINDAILFLRKLDAPTAQEIQKGLSDVSYDLELERDYVIDALSEGRK